MSHKPENLSNMKFEGQAQRLVVSLITVGNRVSQDLASGFRAARQLAQTADELIEDAEMAILLGEMRRELVYESVQPVTSPDKLKEARLAYFRAYEFIRHRDEAKLPPVLLRGIAGLHRLRHPNAHD